MIDDPKAPAVSGQPALPTGKIGYNRLLLLVAGLGGLLYGVDVGIIAGALPYLEATFKDAATGQTLNAGQLSFIVAAVLLGSVISTLFAGMQADWLGRKKMMVASGILFVVSIPIIALAHGYWPLVFGRLLQGISGGLIGVIIPLYLAECLSASNRGKGTGIFQWLLTLGILAAALIAMYFSYQVDSVKALHDPQKFFEFQDHAWRSIFWVSLPPGILFVIGSFMVAESPRWLFRRGKKDAALAALLRSRSDEQALIELQEMETTAAAEKSKIHSTSGQIKESLLRRKYVIPFLLACVILACNQATGVNSVIGYNPTILFQAGLSDLQSHWGYVILTSVNFLFTIFGVMLVDKKGRKFLLSLGSAGIIVSLVGAGLLFHNAEKSRVDVKSVMQAMVTADQKLSLLFDETNAASLLEGAVGVSEASQPKNLVIIYSYGDFHAATAIKRSNDADNTPVQISRAGCLPPNKVAAFFQNPFANLDAAANAPLKIDNALISTVPSERNGWLVALSTFSFMAFFALGPGVCVWLALSELMPTRIRSNGMSIALLINQAVSTTIAAIFLPTVGKYGYGTMFFAFASCTAVYFFTATFLMPETKGKTLEEIEEHFEGAKRF
jgi:MFS transporter, SP family, solute carrier family 2 (myo-inositol transporter), member 13